MINAGVSDVDSVYFIVSWLVVCDSIWKILTLICIEKLGNSLRIFNKYDLALKQNKQMKFNLEKL